MKRTVVLAALYAAFTAGAIVTCIFGNAGVERYRALDGYAQTLRGNIAELETLNRNLAEELRLLQSDAATVRLLARGLGYLQVGERRVVISTYTPHPATRAIGFIVQAPPASTSGKPRRETVYLVPLLILFIGLCVDGARARHDG
jgi:cell division protein FtsB